ncbi:MULTISPECIES: hypothetical protein [Methylomonas]|uniref:hypothetical protein n=1 Tax=Methylomonas TaxID=416 RepID=UPI0012F669BD|nr:hypothetical protein [Methylomonas koyamae]
MAFNNYLAYIERKHNRFELTIIDLLYVGNFKGGNASIVSTESDVNRALSSYSVALVEINSQIDGKSLNEMSQAQKNCVKSIAQQFIEMPLNPVTGIKGFKSSYASAILCAHFSNLLPVIDRNVLSGFGIKHQTKQGQVVDIDKYYPRLIDCFWRRMSKSESLTLREIDRDMFVKGANLR